MLGGEFISTEKLNKPCHSNSSERKSSVRVYCSTICNRPLPSEPMDSSGRDLYTFGAAVDSVISFDRSCLGRRDSFNQFGQQLRKV
jgi:hypothetical protein